MKQPELEIDEVETAEVSIESEYGGEVNLENLEVSKLPNLEIKESDYNVALTPVSGGEIKKTQKLEKNAIAPQNEGFLVGGRKFNQYLIVFLSVILTVTVFPVICIFVIVAVNDIYHGRLDLEKYFTQLIALVYGLGTFLAGLGIGSFVKKEPKINSG